MATAADVQGQFMGDNVKSKAGNYGWVGLAPQPDNEGRRISQFRVIHKSAGGADVDRQSVVEALGTLVFESTYRIKAVTSYDEAKKRAVEATRGETILGHAAIAAGMGMENNKILREILSKVSGQ